MIVEIIKEFFLGFATIWVAPYVWQMQTLTRDFIVDGAFWWQPLALAAIGFMIMFVGMAILRIKIPFISVLVGTPTVLIGSIMTIPMAAHLVGSTIATFFWFVIGIPVFFFQWLAA